MSVVKNLYIAYTFKRDTFKWLNKKEMIHKYDKHDNTPITIEFLNQSGEHHIERTYYKNGNIFCKTPYRNGLLHGYEEAFWENGIIKCELLYKNDELHGLAKSYHNNGSIEEKDHIGMD